MVDWITDRRLFAVAVVIYGISTIYAVFLWRHGFRRDNRITYLLLGGGFVFHTLAMVERGMSFARCPVGNLFEATVFVGWSMVLGYLVIGLMRRLRFLGAFASPVLFSLGVFALIPDLDRAVGPEGAALKGWTSLHISLILLAYGAFGVAAVASAMYLTQEHNLKFHKLKAVFARFPPIQRLEKVSIRLVVVGAVLMLVGLVIGGWVVRQDPKFEVFEDAKVYWSFLVWGAYVVLVVMHWRFDWVGRRFAWTALAVFGFILLTFWGTNLLSPIHNP